MRSLLATLRCTCKSTQPAAKMKAMSAIQGKNHDAKCMLTPTVFGEKRWDGQKSWHYFRTTAVPSRPFFVLSWMYISQEFQLLADHSLYSVRCIFVTTILRLCTELTPWRSCKRCTTAIGCHRLHFLKSIQEVRITNTPIGHRSRKFWFSLRKGKE